MLAHTPERLLGALHTTPSFLKGTCHRGVDMDKWGSCPSEVVTALFPYLTSDPTDSASALKTMRLVNKHWCTTLSKGVTYLKPHDLEQNEFPRLVKALSERFTSVVKLELPAPWISDTHCRSISQFPTLAELDFFWFDNVTDEGMKHISDLPALSHLKIYHCRQLTNKSLKFLGKTGMIELWLYGGVAVTDEGLKQLADCTSLTSLRFMYCNSITGSGLQAFLARPRMKMIVRFCKGVAGDIQIG